MYLRKNLPILELWMPLLQERHIVSKTSDNDIELLIQRALAGDKAAKERFFTLVQQFITSLDLRQLGPMSRDPECVAEVCARVVSRLMDNDYQRLRRFLERPQRSFRAFLQVVTTRVAMDLARSMRESLAARAESSFRWISEVPLSTTGEQAASRQLPEMHLVDIYHYLQTRADPLDVQLLELSIRSRKSWQEIGTLHNLSAAAARQRAQHLQASLRSWLERRPVYPTE